MHLESFNHLLKRGSAYNYSVHTEKCTKSIYYLGLKYSTHCSFLHLRAVSTAVVENIERLCHCGILERDLTNYSGNADKVAFRAELSAPVPYINLSTVFSYLSQWVEGGAHITVAGKLLTVDPMCSVQTQSFMEQECQSNTPITVESILAPVVGGGVAAVVFRFLSWLSESAGELS